MKARLKQRYHLQVRNPWSYAYEQLNVRSLRSLGEDAFEVGRKISTDANPYLCLYQRGFEDNFIKQYMGETLSR